MPKRIHPLKINEVSYNSATQKCYKFYVSECEKNNKQIIPYKEWRNIILTANKLLVEKILHASHIDLPHGLSSFLIAKFKQKVIKKNKKLNLPINWKLTKELGKYVYHDNAQTEGYLLKFFWYKSAATFKYREIYAFKAIRPVTRAIAPLQNTEDKPTYISLDTIQKKFSKGYKKYPKDVAVIEFDGKTKKPVKRWENHMELLEHYQITMTHFAKLITLPSKRWLRGKTYLVYDFKKEYEHIQ